MKLGAFAAENKVEVNDLRQKLYAKNNTPSFDALRRLSWELAENNFKASVTQLEKDNHKEAFMRILDAE